MRTCVVKKFVLFEKGFKKLILTYPSPGRVWRQGLAP